MKATLTNKELSFKPIDITITCENEHELKYLWKLFNMDESKVNETTSVYDFEPMYVCSGSVWEMIETELNALGVAR